MVNLGVLRGKKTPPPVSHVYIFCPVAAWYVIMEMSVVCEIQILIFGFDFWIIFFPVILALLKI